MKTIQMTLDEDLLDRIDKVIHKLKTTRSAFLRESAQYYLERLRIKKLEQKHREGYLRLPVKTGEFNVWEDEQIWRN
jgi:metal-responsive CopG/Arc/MetJ family transcriptional regulator